MTCITWYIIYILAFANIFSGSQSMTVSSNMFSLAELGWLGWRCTCACKVGAKFHYHHGRYHALFWNINLPVISGNNSDCTGEVFGMLQDKAEDGPEPMDLFDAWRGRGAYMCTCMTIIICVSESIESLCRDGINMFIVVYIGKPSKTHEYLNVSKH